MLKQVALPSVLGICIDEPCLRCEQRGLDYRVADSARHAMELMRVLQFDLILIGTTIPDMSFWEMAHRIRRVNPWQKWAMVSGAKLNDHQEIAVRGLGVSGIFETIPSADELANICGRARRPSRVPVRPLFAPGSRITAPA